MLGVEQLSQRRALPSRLDRGGSAALVGRIDADAQVRVAYPALGLDELAVEAAALGALACELLHLDAQRRRT